MSTLFNDALAHLGRSVRESRNLPPVRLSNPATEFVDNRVEINSSGNPNKPDRESSPPPADSGEKQSPTKGADDSSPQGGNDEDTHCKQFAEVLQSFENDLPSKYKTRFNLHDKHSWSEVIEEASIAEMKYRKKADNESPFGKVRGFFRSLQKKSPAVEGWLVLLPTESEYGSLICGGFKVILRAAARMDEIREFIIKALAAIPDEVEAAQLIIDYNQDLDTSKRLYRRVSSLYYTVFGVLEHIITWYSHRSPARHFKAILQQSVYEKNLEDKVKDFKAAVSAVKDEATLCGNLRLYNIQENSYAMQKLLQSLVEQLRSNPRLHPHTGQPLPPQPPQPQVPKRKAISRQSLCESVLRYERDVPLEDLTSIMHRGSELSLEEQDRIVYVIESQALISWLLNPKNAVLLVRENSGDLDSGASAMSFVAAHVIQSTRQTQKSRLLCLYWFAGQHRNVRNDADANVHGIMRSLIGQLLHMYNRFDLYFIKRSTAIAIRENDLEALCNVFDELIFQLPEKTVTFCVIDRLACLEYDQKEEVQFLLDRLRAIARHASGKGSLFKLLLTHAGGAFRAAATFDRPGEILDVLEGGDGNRMGFNKLMWDAKVSSKIDHLTVRSKRQG
ncbi:hypothetical protein F4779DRAFT_629767 [Xylariaceae sp. FL0662B]|nr:hypothetical protein F4779DRAFT_629767 [Xylariaceae sp. FL0662B]